MWVLGSVGCEPLCGCWEVYIGPLDVQQALLSAEPSLCPHHLFYRGKQGGSRRLGNLPQAMQRGNNTPGHFDPRSLYPGASFVTLNCRIIMTQVLPLPGNTLTLPYGPFLLQAFTKSINRDKHSAVAYFQRGMLYYRMEK
jgi:hypothetical protein